MFTKIVEWAKENELMLIGVGLTVAGSVVGLVLANLIDLNAQGEISSVAEDISEAVETVIQE